MKTFFKYFAIIIGIFVSMFLVIVLPAAVISVFYGDCVANFAALILIAVYVAAGIAIVEAGVFNEN
jgi:hypothetical protein